MPDPSGILKDRHVRAAVVIGIAAPGAAEQLPARFVLCQRKVPEIGSKSRSCGGLAGSDRLDLLEGFPAWDAPTGASGCLTQTFGAT